MRDARTDGDAARRRRAGPRQSLAWPPRSVAAARTSQLPDDADDAGRTAKSYRDHNPSVATQVNTETRQDPT